ncbi:DUF3226 domain-containing protein [Cellulophaga sp. HaHa_2_1]|uniref:DUF3226 domain-containing protein n=1 Tax=Cellulophaga sp. HaHa_2_1 TaxID=2749994 RepID=UPI001C4E4210|nr:DUF3226 domain-containing protein [Cellulophaga sp. HaHa_2_1]QXP52543.1 hypothetical protein H0I24_01045 [Cellulophaga sp. HaHa_2_1]
MINNVLFILAEGDHDIAFIYRILKVNGFKTHNKKIKEYNEPLSQLFQSDILNISIPEVNIMAAKSKFLPYRVMISDVDKNNTIVLYSIGGDSKDENRISLLKALNAFNQDDDDDLSIQAYPGTEISVLYFFDADEEGTDFRMNQIREELVKAFPHFPFEATYDASVFHTIEDMKIGAYIFREVDNDKGMLEDVLLPLMQEDNGDIFEAAEAFLAINKTCALYKDKLKYDKVNISILKKVSSDKYAHRKSLIGTVGQLQKSGKSNTVCISDADYITEDKINSNTTCMEIIALIKTVII